MNKKIFIIIFCFIFAVFGLALIFRLAAAGKAQRPGETPQITIREEGAMLEKAERLVSGGELLKAKEIYQNLVDKFPNSSSVERAQESLEAINIRVLFSPVITPDSFAYEVEKGDTLTGIAKKFHTTVELITGANNLKSSSLRIGEKLKISKARFSIVVDKSQNILTLKSDQEIVKTYRVATGKNSSTPVGVFTITNRIVDPPWYPPNGGVIPAKDPRNVLGSRWMGISKPSYGIHGTTQPESIGKSVTEGCVRLKNSDIEELYAIVPEGTNVVIID